MAEQSRAALAQFLRALAARRGELPLRSIPLAESLQPQVQIDDLSALATPFPVTRVWLTTIASSGGGLFATTRVTARAGGCFVGTLRVSPISGVVRVATNSGDALSSTSNVVPVTRVGPPLVSTITNGRAVATLPIPAFQPKVSTTSADFLYALDLFLQPGETLDVRLGTANAPLTTSFELQEVPVFPTP